MKLIFLLLVVCIAQVCARTVYDDDDPFDYMREFARVEPVRQVVSLMTDLGRKLINTGRYDVCKCSDGRLPVCNEYSSFCECLTYRGVEKLLCHPEVRHDIIREQERERRRENYVHAVETVVCRPSAGTCDVEPGKVCNPNTGLCDTEPVGQKIEPTERYNDEPITRKVEPIVPERAPCEPGEVCNGLSVTCPSDDLPPIYTQQKKDVAIGECDAAEYCLGSTRSTDEDQKHFVCDERGCTMGDFCGSRINTSDNDHQETEDRHFAKNVKMWVFFVVFAVLFGCYVYFVVPTTPPSCECTPPALSRRQRRTLRRREQRAQARAAKHEAEYTDLSTLFPEEEEGNTKIKSDPRPEDEK